MVLLSRLLHTCSYASPVVCRQDTTDGHGIHLGPRLIPSRINRIEAETERVFGWFASDAKLQALPVILKVNDFASTSPVL